MKSIIKNKHIDFLMRLLNLNTISPMETGRISRIPDALNECIRFTEDFGGFLRRKLIPDSSHIMQQGTPEAVKIMQDTMGQDFFTSQPSAVIEFGTAGRQSRKIMLNFHLDTVDGFITPTISGDCFIGRGAVDTKGLGVAAIAGIEDALSRLSPDSGIGVILQIVSGEEGGAMGSYGTRALIQEGHFGDVNIFLEPTDGMYMDTCSASMTASIEMNGLGSTDDFPADGVNATLVLSFFASQLSEILPQLLNKGKVKMCLAGIYTGSMHNRVYGKGKLMFNFIYTTPDGGRFAEDCFAKAFSRTVEAFKQKYSSEELFAHTVKSLDRTLSYKWLKKDLPVLNNRSKDIEKIFREVNISRFLDQRQLGEAFTCDAIWSPPEASYSCVLGGGNLSANNAHAEGEFITLQQLEQTAGNISDIILSLQKRSGN